jgi:hypothetical protein
MCPCIDDDIVGVWWFGFGGDGQNGEVLATHGFASSGDLCFEFGVVAGELEESSVEVGEGIWEA